MRQWKSGSKKFGVATMESRGALFYFLINLNGTQILFNCTLCSLTRVFNKRIQDKI